MSKYVIEIKKSVKKDLRRIPLTERKEIMNLIEALSDNPRPPGWKKLKGKESMYRIRYKNYRVLYEDSDSGIDLENTGKTSNAASISLDFFGG